MAKLSEVRALAARRMRVAVVLTLLTIVAYFGFILLVAFDKARLAVLLAPGLSVGIALGAAVIVVAWVLTGIYVRWANRTYDAELEALRKNEPR